MNESEYLKKLIANRSGGSPPFQIRCEFISLHVKLYRSGPSLNVVFDIERELERANALGAFLSIDEYSPEALVASLELFT